MLVFVRARRWGQWVGAAVVVASLATTGCAPMVAGALLASQSGGGGGGGKAPRSAPPNLAPTFDAGPDIAVDEDCGPVTLEWATAISPGPPEESHQSTRFSVVSITNPSLFSSAPAVSREGRLSFTPATDANGRATVGVVLRDNGGTANGGRNTSAVHTLEISVQSANDAPSFTPGDDVEVARDVGAVAITGWATNVIAGPADEESQTLAFAISTNDPSLFTEGPVLSLDGTLSFTPSGLAGAAVVSLTLSDDGGTAGGGVDRFAVSFEILVMKGIACPTGDDFTVLAGEELTFDVTAELGRTGPTRLSLAWVPAGCVVDAAPTPSGVRKRVRWLVPLGLYVGPYLLSFVATDGVNRERRSISVKVISRQHCAFARGDVTGDGIEDVVVGASLAGSGDTGAVYVWAGGALDPAPVARLVVPGGVAGESLAGVQLRESIVLGDFTGDGQLDLIVRAQRADTRRGALYLWAGGTTLVGQPAPLAVLSVPDAQESDVLGQYGVMTGDLTGDGVPDVLATTPRASAFGLFRCGAVYVWAGGAGLTGPCAPLATLRVPVAADDFLGLTLSSSGTYVVDLDRDGLQDVVVAAPEAARGGRRRGAVFVWKGASDLAGFVDPHGTLAVPQPTDDDRFGDGFNTGDPEPIRIADVTGDGSLDIVVSGSRVEVGGTFVWTGERGFAGAPAPAAILFVTSGATRISGVMQAVTDVTGDGVVDVLVRAGGEPTGALYVWAGGATLDGTPAATAILTDAGAQSFASSAGSGRAVQIVDVTGDAVDDVVVTCSGAAAGGVINRGAIYVFAGGSTLQGRPAPHATLTVPDADASDLLGATGGSGSQGVMLGDVTGDQVPDVIALAVSADLDGIDRGAMYVFQGGATLAGAIAPLATARVSGARDGDLLGTALSAGETLQLADLDLDGTLDLVVAATLADRATTDAGAVYVWRGGPTLRGVVDPRATLALSSPTAGERIGQTHYQGVHLADANDDQRLDVFVATPWSANFGSGERGAVYQWLRAESLVGVAAPDAFFTGTDDFERLSKPTTAGPVFDFTDVTGDGICDLRVLSPRTATGGRVYVWPGGATPGVVPPIHLEVPGALPDDRLGDVQGP